tara:strand:- start:1383 stop:1775 length:393 start_codon:yes stop_codon:yes gene_type:complete
MEIKLTKKESEDAFYDSLCNGLNYLSGYGLLIDYKKEEYQKAKASFLKKNPKRTACYEDILMEILFIGGNLLLDDTEDPEAVISINLKDVHEKVSNTDGRHLLDSIEERGDAITADCILQTVFLGEVIYG